MRPEALRVLLVEDSASDALLVRTAVAASGARLSFAHADRLSTALEHLRREGADVVLLDLGLPDSAGLETLERLQAGAAEAAVVVLTGLDDESLATAALQRGAQDYLPKREATSRALMRVIRYAHERRRAEAALRMREQRYRSLVAATSQMVWTMGPDGRAIDDSPSWSAYTGQSREESLDLGWAAAIHPEDRERTLEVSQRAAEARVPFEVEHRVRAADGSYGEFVTRGVPVLEPDGRIREWIGICVDVTRQTQLEQQLRQAQKMEAVGRLAGGIAHDFNNLLTAVLGYTSLLADRFAADQEALGELREVQKAGERAAALTRQLLAFSRKQVLQPCVLDLAEVVADTGKLLERLIGEDVELRIVARRPFGRVKADRGQLEQVILNLAVNARDAMPDGGRLTLETAIGELTAEDVVKHEVRPGWYAVLSVTDTGVGMDAGLLSHLFEPFFTTKEVGKGTGLGLATVYGIVRQSEGHVAVESEPGRGSTFRIYLPLVEEPARGKASAAGATATDGAETILLVDDEPAIRGVARVVLQQHGYRVLEAATVAAAIEAIETDPAGVHLVLTDVVMPGTSGWDLLTRLGASSPEVRVILMSGYPAEELAGRRLEPGICFLQKPFTADDLLRKVREALDAVPVAALR